MWCVLFRGPKWVQDTWSTPPSQQCQCYIQSMVSMDAGEVVGGVVGCSVSAIDNQQCIADVSIISWSYKKLLYIKHMTMSTVKHQWWTVTLLFWGEGVGWLSRNRKADLLKSSPLVSPLLPTVAMTAASRCLTEPKKLSSDGNKKINSHIPARRAS